MARTEKVMVRMNDQERQMLKELTQKEDRSESQLIRLLVRQEHEKRFGGERISSINAEITPCAQ